jgi:hypothetical protein
MWYRDFEPVSDEEVQALLSDARKRSTQRAAKAGVIADTSNRLISEGMSAAQSKG